MSDIRQRHHDADTATILMISYYFPPLGGGGVQRNLKFCKYLPSYGCYPVVLTTKNISYHSYDNNLLKELPVSCNVVRTGSFDFLRISYLLQSVLRRIRGHGRLRDYSGIPPVMPQSTILKIYRCFRNIFFVPDGQVGWIPFAVIKGVVSARKYKCSVVFGSIGPVSSAIVAFLVSRICNLPFVLDFRDGWTDDPFLPCPTAVHRYIHRKLESMIVPKASAVCVYGAPLDSKLILKYPGIRGKMHVLPNGYDPDDFKSIPSLERSCGANKIRITWTGNLYRNIHHDTVVTLIKALERIDHHTRSRLEVLIVGNTYKELHEIVGDHGLGDVVSFMGSVPHSQSLAHLKSSSLALMMLAKNDFGSVSGKIFEYLYLGRPILALVEQQGTCGSILKQTGRGEYLCAPDSVDEVADAIMRIASDELSAKPQKSIEMYDRRVNTRRLAEIFHNVAKLYF